MGNTGEETESAHGEVWIFCTTCMVLKRRKQGFLLPDRQSEVAQFLPPKGPASSTSARGKVEIIRD